MTVPKYSFKANVRLKDIIGQGLINNSNIAIIELIKNARDANSKSVNIHFSAADNIDSSSKLVVQDFGNGMSFDDVIHKWLNIAYSEKRKNSTASFAGDKGIGRFSCDRLGKTLDLYTKKKNGDLIHLAVNWTDFEVDDIEKEISSIELFPAIISDAEFTKKTKLEKFSSGTCLVIRNLRESWGRSELPKLKKELERFIIDPNETFKVYLRSDDITNKKGKLIYNGPIQNKLATKLDDKSISVRASISEDGKLIKTELRHYGTIILSYEEDNSYSELRNIKAHIHYLNPPSKISFKSITGYKSFEYGSVMLFFNGFRVMPYGDPKDDWLQLNQRKAQGTMRNLGTRELFGIVEINDNRRKFSPVSSREGMENNLAFKQLADLSETEDPKGALAFTPNLIRVLEKFVVEGIDWDRVNPKSGNYSRDEILAALDSFISSQKRKTLLKNIYVNERKISEIASQKIAEYDEFVHDLTERVKGKSVYELTPAEKRDIKKYVVRQDAIVVQKEKTNKAYKRQVVVETKKRMYAESHLKPDSVRYREMTHHIGHLSKEVYRDLRKILQNYNENNDILVESLIEKIRSSFFQVEKIRKLTKIITKSGFDMMSDMHKTDYFVGIEEYINEIMNVGVTWEVRVQYENASDIKLILNFSPLEQAMLLDNVLENSKKANAKKLIVKAHQDAASYYLDFSDDGRGLNAKYDVEHLFEAGITTTNGAGIGLSHIKQITEKLDGKVSIFNNKEKGCTLRVQWSK
ncbi:MAG: ATP-binding protein [Robiginitomaculum sp.]|nr:ATP-binding protein [Robiginitomaculum sp.]